MIPPAWQAGEQEQEQKQTRFELTDVSIIFPDGELTVITGPTASGKSALLVSCLIFDISEEYLIFSR